MSDGRIPLSELEVMGVRRRYEVLIGLLARGGLALLGRNAQ